ncbi:YIP1 family protein [Paenibacillus sp. HJGM_3]|uniref:YIP1 family protein n=1 Tax=Paenibacillus sp. HJGM_3 TaxID=3379816 RepID=UPI00385B0709
MIGRFASGLWKFNVKLFTVLILFGLIAPTAASAKLPYNTYYVDPLTYKINRIQPIYVPDRIVDGNGMKVPLSAPSDLFIADNDHVYVADTGNNRVVELDPEGRYIRSIGEEEGPGKLNRPEGVFVAKDGTIYVADTASESIVKYAANGKVERVFTKPESALLGKDYFFLPTKLAVDNRGFMYVVVKDTYQGLVRMNPEGSFTGFFGANKAKLDWLDRVKRAMLNKVQLAKEVAKRPNSIENVTLSDEGFLFTTSMGKGNDGQIKKLNAGATDAFKNKPFREQQLVDTAVDRNGFLYGMNRQFNEISIYDPTGNVMFYFSEGDKNARQLGVTSFASSIAVNGKNELWVADSRSNLIHVFARTSFGDTFLTAAHYYFEGDYEQSKTYWEEVVRQNGMLNISYNGLGKIALHEKQYETALGYFQQSYDAQGYSDAFWNIRYEWIQSHFILVVLIAAVAVWVLVFAGKRGKAFVARRTWPGLAVRYAGELRDSLYVMIHPYQGFYRLKDCKVSWFVLLLLLALAVGVHIWSIFGSGFIAYPFDLGTYNLKWSLTVLIVPWATWVLANYLVSAVKGGEGRFREVFQASTFAIVPYIVLKVPAVLLSNVVVLEEWILIDLIHRILWIWIIVLFFVMTQVIHNFDFVEAIKNAGITLFTIGVIWVFVLIMTGLGINLYDFLDQMYREVTFNG